MIAATNRDLKKEVLAGRFRLDLFYRLNVIGILIPPLRERLSDIPELIDCVMDVLVSKGIGRIDLSPEIVAVLCEHDWPGNVRELENTVERILLLYPDGDIRADEVKAMLLDSRIEDREFAEVQQPQPATHLSQADFDIASYPVDLTLRVLEEMHVRRVLKLCKGNKTKAAQALGINVKTLYNKMKAIGLKKEQFTSVE